MTGLTPLPDLEALSDTLNPVERAMLLLLTPSTAHRFEQLADLLGLTRGQSDNVATLLINKGLAIVRPVRIRHRFGGSGVTTTERGAAVQKILRRRMAHD